MKPNKLNPGIWISLYAIVTFIKIIFVFFGGGIEYFNLGGGNDADYYDDAALQQGEYAVNIWPLLLSSLVDLGLYSRTGLAHSLMFASSVLIPYLVVRISILNRKILQNKKLWFAFFIIGAYPALFFFSLDIYRDIFMVIIFLLGLFAVKALTRKNALIIQFIYLAYGIALGYILFGLREYLGATYFLMLAFAIFSRSTIPYKIGIKPLYLLIFYLIFIYLLNFSGLFEALIQYRTGFREGAEGSTFGLKFDSPLLFLPNFLLSWFFQIFGLWPFTPLAVALFFLESLFFIVTLHYISRNKELISPFGWSIILFFITYNTVWVIGNDNLGTAWRLRIYSYLSVFILFLEIYQRNIRQNKLKNK